MAKTPRYLTAILLGLAAALMYAWTYQCPDLPAVRNSVVLITGASSGIGAELAVQYGGLGARLVLAARRRTELEATAEAAKAAGAVDVLVLPTDMSDGSQVEALISAAVDRFGRLDKLILNHAMVDDALFSSHGSPASLDDSMLAIFRANVMGSAYAARAALPHLEATGGHIAVVGSASAKVAAPFHAGYVASKHALHGVFDTLRAELHLAGSTVTIGIQVLGMIATKEVLRDPALAGLAAPVPSVAREMICAAQARWYEVYVPRWYGPWTLVTYIGGSDFAEWVMNAAYIFKVPRYREAVARERERVQALHVYKGAGPGSGNGDPATSEL